MKKMKHVYKIYVPIIKKDYRHVDEICRDISLRHGGATVSEHRGFYVMQDGSLAYDQICIVSAFTRKRDFSFFETIAREIKTREKQESVLIEENGKAVLI